ncbi:MAG: hypothetical protein WCI36_00495 [bacterium]
MMNYQKAAINIAFLTVIMTGGICSGSKNKDNKRHMNRKLILEAFESGDYETWSRIVKKNTDLVTVIAEDEFIKFIDARNAARVGDYEKSIALSSALEFELRGKLGDLLFC